MAKVTVYEQRLKRLRGEMAVQGWDGVFVMLSSDLQYLTGVLRPPHNPTDDNKYGDELYGAFITQDRGPIFVVPRMGASKYVQTQTVNKPWVEDIVVIPDGVIGPDGVDPLAVAREVLQRLGHPKRLGVPGRLWARSIFRLQAADPELILADASGIIAGMRAVKDAEEIAIMQEAGVITDQVFGAVLKQMRLGMTEYDIMREIDHQIIVQGGSGVSFHTGVVIRGEGIKRQYHANGQTPNTPIQPGAVISFDFGITHRGYVSDFGRTVFCGDPRSDFVRYHELVMASQAAGIAAMRSGQVTAAELNRIARKVLEDEGLGQYFTHRLGHGIGIDVHESPFLFGLDRTVLTTGMCFTIEPSIVIPDLVGVRVEDVVMVTEDGGLPFSHFSRKLLVI